MKVGIGAHTLDKLVPSFTALSLRPSDFSEGKQGAQPPQPLAQHHVPGLPWRKLNFWEFEFLVWEQRRIQQPKSGPLRNICKVWLNSVENPSKKRKQADKQGNQQGPEGIRVEGQKHLLRGHWFPAIWMEKTFPFVKIDPSQGLLVSGLPGGCVLTAGCLPCFHRYFSKGLP